MFTVVKIFSISCSHKLDLDYLSNCTRVHGHNYKVEVGITNDNISHETGMIMDFNDIKKIFKENVEEYLDHRHLNDLPDFKLINPTAEAMSKFIFDRLKPHIKNLSFIKVWETDTSYCNYREI